MELRAERQRNEVADEYSALVAVSRPIIAGLLHSIGEEFLRPHGGRESIRLGDLGRVRKANDGDAGVAFEYAIHDAMLRREQVVTERVSDALKLCKIKKGDPSSILFAMEKSGSSNLIDTAANLITDNSSILSGEAGRPVKLKPQLNKLSAAFRRASTRPALPSSIQGLWKADLLLGSTEEDRWVGSSLRINGRLESARGLRVAIVPIGTTKSDKIVKDEQKNLVVCPIPHDFSFMQTFHEGLRIVQALVESDFREPKRIDIPNPIHREVAKVYVERRDFSVLEVLDAVKKFAQPELLELDSEQVNVQPIGRSLASDTDTVIGPIPRRI